MIFSFDLRKARKGDCYLLHWGEDGDGKSGLIVVDGGPASVYKPHLKPRLVEIKKARKLGDDDPLPIDALMVSHIDDDHIHGVLDLTAELIAAANEQKRALVRVRELWHNSFDEMVGNTPEESRAALTAGLVAAAESGDNLVFDGKSIDAHAAKVLASVGQGHRLRNDARRLGWRVNPRTDGELVMAGASSDPIRFDDRLTLTVVGPMKPELDALRKSFEDFLEKAGHGRNTPEAALAAFTDPSVPNLSSIVLLAEAGGRRMLLTGDARGDKILEGLQLAGLLRPIGTMHVDLLKVPHHGSDRNIDQIFFERITADHYVFSGDGEHGNPERAALEMLFDVRGNEPFTIHFTYPIDEIDRQRERDWIKELKKGRKERPWSPSQDSLAAFLGARNLAAAGQKVAIVDATTSHVIDLLGPLGF